MALSGIVPRLQSLIADIDARRTLDLATVRSLSSKIADLTRADNVDPSALADFRNMLRAAQIDADMGARLEDVLYSKLDILWTLLECAARDDGPGFQSAIEDIYAAFIAHGKSHGRG